ncbi:MAG: hypothetical protein ACYDA9_00465 [Terriglobia bacterium]
MIKRIKYLIGILGLALLVAIAVSLSPSMHRVHAASQDQKNQQDQQDQKKDSNQNQTQSEQQQKKKKGGLFGGLKKVSGVESGQESAATTSAGSKSVGEGKKIGEMTPTAADRQQVTDMENYSVPQPDLKKFQDDGHLQPKK